MEVFAMRTLRLIAILASIIALSACGTTGGPKTEYYPVEFTNGKKLTIASQSQVLPDFLLPLSSIRTSYIVEGEVTADQIENVNRAETVCRLHTENSRASVPVIIAINGIVYGLTGYLGVGLGAKAFGAAVKYREYARYGGTAGLFSGMGNGLITIAGRSYTFKNCTREALDAAKLNIRVLTESPY
jgi:hypothetical protein